MTSEQASQKKELGHAEERTFNAFFGDKNNRDTNFSGASADNQITNKKYLKKIETKLGKLKSNKVSLKSGSTWQFHLGRIEELSPLKEIEISETKKGHTKIKHSVLFEKQKIVLKDKSFWNKYFGKGDLLCYNDKQKKYTFFRMDTCIDFLRKNIEWELLETGRLKGHLKLGTKNRSVLTFEYRKKKKSFAFGAMAGKNGIVLFEILKENLIYQEIEFESSIEKSKTILLQKKKYIKNMTGKIGETFFDNDYFYICINSNSWKKVKLEKL